MDFDEIELGEDELTPAKPYTPERQEEINELWTEIASLLPDVTA